MKKRNQRYTTEFKAEAVKLVTEQGLSQEAAANRLGIPKGTMGNWIVAAKAYVGIEGQPVDQTSKAFLPPFPCNRGKQISWLRPVAFHSPCQIT